jgi:hypothetical protein
MAVAMPLPLAVSVIEETLDPPALMKLAPLAFTGRVKVTAAPALSSPVTVAVMMLVCPALTEVVDAATETDRSVVGGGAVFVIVMDAVAPTSVLTRTVSEAMLFPAV